MNRIRSLLVSAGLSVAPLFQAPSAAAEASPDQAHGPKPAASFPTGVTRPIITDKFTADPHAVVFSDTYYVYPTSDKDNSLAHRTTGGPGSKSKFLSVSVQLKNDVVVNIWKDKGGKDQAVER